MGNPLGAFSAGMHGKITTLKTSFDSHAAATISVHGGVAAATANKLMIRDGSGRVSVVAPAAANNTDLVPTTAWVQTELTNSGFGTVTSITAGVGMTGGVIVGAGTIGLANTAVAAGIFTLANITVDAQGRITAASSGVAVTGVTATAPILSTGGNTPVISIPAATGSINGYMSAADKAKLNNIAAGATNGPVTTVFGRAGVVTAQTGDYTVQKIAGITISDVPPTGGSDGDIHFEF